MSTRVAIVTGGSRGIGRAIVERLVNDGVSVITCGRGERPPDLPTRVHWVRADVAQPDDCDSLISSTTERMGPIDVLVNNAGVQVERNVIDTTDDDWDLVVGVNCKGVFNMSRAVLPGMARTGGVIINVSSIAGPTVAEPRMALYNASKAFVDGLTRSIAIDHGPHVRCNAVRPGWISTRLLDDALSSASDPRAAKRDAVSRHASKRFGQPSDVANLVAWLASRESDFVTGQCFTIDGGLTIGSPIRPDLS